MRDESPAARAGPDPEILRWRVRALDLVLWTSLALGTVTLAVLFLVVPEAASPEKRLLGLAFFVTIAVLSVARRIPHPVRAWGFLLTVLGLASLALAARGLDGAGRLFLLVTPFFATVLLGRRSGYAAAAASLALYLGAASLIATGTWTPLALRPGETLEPKFWLFQGVLLVLVQWPVLVLFDRFAGHLQDSSAAERQANLERRRLERELTETAELERREVGHRLHDGACQGITAAALRCQLVRNALAARGSVDEVAHLEEVAGLLSAALKEIHGLACGLSPAEVSPGAFTTALDDLADRVRCTAGIECDLLHDGLAGPVDPETTTHLFWIAQEAVNNALRHGNPGRIEIELARADRALRLRVVDDGTGMPEHGEGAGMGLRIMRHRAERIGGALTIGPAATGGTVVTCAVPLAPPVRGNEESR